MKAPAHVQHQHQNHKKSQSQIPAQAQTQMPIQCESALKPIRGYRKEEMLYPDRCMLKWRGMLLSDHSEMMADQEEEGPISPATPPSSLSPENDI